MKNLYKASEIKRTLLIVYYYKTDSQAERINQEVKTFLWHYINYQQDNWSEWLSTARFQYNNKRHLAMGYMPLKNLILDDIQRKAI